jgi:hypothetical protein
MAIDPRKELEKYPNQSLIIQGTTDIQVSELDAENLHQANEKSTLVIIKEMNHILKKVSSDIALNKKSYNDPNLPLHSDLIIEMVNFLKK